MPIKKTILLGERLIQKGLISYKDLDLGLKEHQRTGQFLGTTLVKLGFIEEDKLYPVLSEQLKIPYLKIKDLAIPHEVFEKVPAKYACHYKLIPVKFEKDTITIAVADPLDVRTLDDLKLLLGCDVAGVLATESDINEGIKKYYGIGAETIEEIVDTGDRTEEIALETRKTENIEDLVEDASIIKFVNQILVQGVKDGATDIHIEPYEDELKVRYRIDGVLYDVSVPANIRYFQAAIVSRLKIMAHLDIAERRLPQDGRIRIRVGNDELDLRISILPTQFGESVDIRILSSAMLYSLKNLGLLSSDLDILEKLIKKPHGIIFVTGPTGSGKTTTLYSCLSKINKKDKKIITIEDPIEYQLKGVTQIQIHPRIGLSFAAGLRSMLRHDPDIMMVGEVRDFETAEITIRVALTGHLVFSTLHTNDAAGGITRLLDMGVEPYLAASSVECFIAQRLVRLICPQCKVKKKLDKKLLEGFKIKDDARNVTIYESKGCEACKFSGYKGRTGLYEFLVMNEDICELALQRASSDQIKKKALELGMHTLRMDGWEKIKRGLTTIDEVMRVTEED
ncbi:MAG: Flp pilus assembly complex ATPase component TadA [Candidatus Omnitrophica bacterium]|nr:Flp pilus assembly complex ATPase component TadA [Candidatus Omnitrophota bacterium]MBU4589329.1 Flp pilus assembly complex ATPase component TadA [Candidatus Omnitrophota bacterium]